MLCLLLCKVIPTEQLGQLQGSPQSEQIKVLENLIDTLKSKAKIEYVNDEYNPEKIQEALKKHAKSDPTVKEELEPASTSATPTPKKGK